MIEIEWVAGKDDLREVHRVREEVFIKGQGIAWELEMDDMDAKSEHILIKIDGLPVATGRLYQKDGQQMFGRVSVLPEHRGKHLGMLVVKNLLERAFGAGAAEVHIHAQAYLEKYYGRLGFATYGEHFIEAGIDHISMVARRDGV